MKSPLRSAFFTLTVLFVLLTHAASSQSPDCGHIQSNNISFNPGSCTLLPAAQTSLNQLAEQMRADPECKVVVMGNAGGNKPAQELSWEHVNAVIEYMGESNNIDRLRFIFRYEGTALIDHVMFRAALPGEEGPSNVAQPDPGAPPCK